MVNISLGERMKKKDKEVLEKLTKLHQERCLLLGVDLDSLENKDTPIRCAKADLEHFENLPLNFKIFKNTHNYNQMIAKTHIPFTSLCSHHLHPYIGHVNLGYIPDTHICGLSKLARLVNTVSKGAQSQEWLTETIANFLEKQLKPKGVIVEVRAIHTCESTRGVRNNNGDSLFVTSSVRGVFADNKDQSRMEFFSLVR